MQSTTTILGQVDKFINVLLIKQDLANIEDTLIGRILKALIYNLTITITLQIFIGAGVH